MSSILRRTGQLIGRGLAFACLVAGIYQPVNAFTPLPDSLPDFYPRQEQSSHRSQNLVDGDITFNESTHTLTVASSGNFVVMTVDPGIYRDLRRARGDDDTTRDALQKVSSYALSHFDDQFDFVIVSHNESESNTAARYLGIHYRVSNEVAGLGKPLTSQAGTFGSAGKLQSVVHLPVSGGLRGGPSLHELMHRWGNSITAIEGDGIGHWGYASVNGVLGGFDERTLVEPIDGSRTYEATGAGFTTQGIESFRHDGYVINSIPYSPLELYLMGARSAARVGDIKEIVGGDRASIYDNTFTGDRIRTITISDIVARDGDRVPTVGGSQKNFRVLYVIVSNDALLPRDWDFHDEQVVKFSRARSDGDDDLLNFWEATDGWGSLRFGGLLDIAHTAVPLTTDHSNLVVTDFEQSSSRIVAGNERNYWFKAVVSQTGGHSIDVGGMRFQLARQNGNSGNPVRCGPSWVPFAFPPGYLIETGLLRCTIDDPGRYRLELKVLIGQEWKTSYKGSAFDVTAPTPAGFRDIVVNQVTSGTDSQATHTIGQEYWFRSKFRNKAESDMTIEGLEVVVKRDNDNATERQCYLSETLFVLEPDEQFDTRRVNCPPMNEVGRFVIIQKVRIDARWRELAKSAAFNVTRPVPATPEDIAVSLTTRNATNTPGGGSTAPVIVGQVGNYSAGFTLVNTSSLATTIENVSFDVLASDGVPEASCYSREAALPLSADEKFESGTFTCPTLTRVGAFQAIVRFNMAGVETVKEVGTSFNVVAPQSPVPEDIEVDQVEFPQGTLVADEDNNFSVRVVLRNNFSDRVKLKGVRFRLIDESGNDQRCYQINRVPQIAPRATYDSSTRRCTLASGRYILKVDVRIDESWYERYQSAAINVVTEPAACSPPGSSLKIETQGLSKDLLVYRTGALTTDNGRSKTSIILAGSGRGETSGSAPTMQEFWLGIHSIESSSDSDVFVNPHVMASNASRVDPSTASIVPAAGRAMWDVEFCNAGWIQFELDFTPRSINLHLASILKGVLKGSGRITANDFIALSSELSAIPSFDSAATMFVRAVSDLRSGRIGKANQRARIGARRLAMLSRDDVNRRALYRAFKKIGVRLGKRRRGETRYGAFVRSLTEYVDDGSLASAVMASFERLNDLLAQTANGSNAASRPMTVRLRAE